MRNLVNSCGAPLLLMLKAMALLNGVTLEKHHQIWEYAEAVSRNVGDPDIRRYLGELDGAHKNFYNLDQDERFTCMALDTARRFLQKIYALIQKQKEGSHAGSIQNGGV